MSRGITFVTGNLIKLFDELFPVPISNPISALGQGGPLKQRMLLCRLGLEVTTEDNYTLAVLW